MTEREAVESLARKTVDRLLAQGEHPEKEAAHWINQRAAVPIHSALEIFAFLTEMKHRLQSNRELDALVSALRGDYLPPGPGGGPSAEPLYSAYR